MGQYPRRDFARRAALSAGQAKIEDHRRSACAARLFAVRGERGEPRLFLYDVTSSYLEGQKNALADYGYPRDGKKGEKQIVIGLLCDETGEPIATEVFRGHAPQQTRARRGPGPGTQHLLERTPAGDGASDHG